MANGVIVPTQNLKSGTTDIDRITWEQRGNVVSVSIVKYTPSVSTGVILTGLPKVAGNKYFFQMLAQETPSLTMLGYVEYNTSNQKWVITGNANKDMYGNFVYLTDE